MKSAVFRKTGLYLLIAGFVAAAAAETSLQIVPSTFDFGWVPDNALVRCQVHVKNTGNEMIALTAVQPSCGCTATDFTPEGLPAAEQTSINLTFNTRGYTGMKFNKSVKVKAGVPEDEYTVQLVGVVADVESMVRPEGDGVAVFPIKGPNKAKLSIKNKSDKALALKVIQDPDSWVQLKLPKAGLPANGSADLDLQVAGSLDENRETSVTIEAGEGDNAHRFTVAIRTGQQPEPYRRLRQAPKSEAKPTPEATPKKKHN